MKSILHILLGDTNLKVLLMITGVTLLLCVFVLFIAFIMIKQSNYSTLIWIGFSGFVAILLGSVVNGPSSKTH